MGSTTRIKMGGDSPIEPALGSDPWPGDPPPGEAEAMTLGAQSTTAAVPTLREFVYDDANRMRQVERDGVVAMSYLYNGKGEQVYKTGSDKTIATLYDEAGHWIGDYEANGQPIQQAIWLDDLPVGLLVGAGAAQKLYYIEADALGTPRVVIDPDRNAAVWKWDLVGEAFGDAVPSEDVDGDGITFVFDMRLPGQRWDSATGMSYNYFRDYDASVGRYVQSDPIGLAGGISTYGYVGGSPLDGIDPAGLSESDLCGCKGGVGKPTGADWNFERANSSWMDKISVASVRGTVIVSGSLTVSGPYAREAARDISRTWAHAAGRYEGVRYKSRVKVTPVDEGGDLQIIMFDINKWAELNSQLCSGVVGAKADDFGGSVIYLAPDSSAWRNEKGLFAHEFGHNFGLRHAWAGSQSIMSYDPMRRALGRDFFNLSEGYGK